MTGLDQAGDDAVDADPVAAHDDRAELLLVVQEAGGEGLGILGPQLEDVAHLDRMAHGELRAAPRAGIAVHRVAEIVVAQRLEVAARIDARDVGLRLVRPGHGVAEELDVVVGVDRDRLFHAHRAGEAHRGAGHLLDHRRIGQGHLGGAGRPANLVLVGLAVAADQDGDRTLVGRVDQRLDDSSGMRCKNRQTCSMVAAPGVGTVWTGSRGASETWPPRGPISAFSRLAA